MREMKEEQKNNISRSNLWNDIYKVVNQIPRENVKGDAMDAPSAATEIEKLFKAKKSFWCKIGFHSLVYTSKHLVTSDLKCTKCGKKFIEGLMGELINY